MEVVKENKGLIKEFINFICKDLNIKKKPRICIQSIKDTIKTTAHYEYGNQNECIIRVYSKNRALVDILRSLSHEMVHHKQYEEGRLETKPQDIGGDIEDEANAIAGQHIKKFSKLFPEIYNTEKILNEEEPTGHPETTKWETGLVRGTANQIAVSKWSDVVDSKMNRGKANRLK